LLFATTTVTIFGGNFNEGGASGESFYASHHCEYPALNLKTRISETPAAFPGLQTQIAADTDPRLWIADIDQRQEE
jgi:hypothetical protein